MGCVFALRATCCITRKKKKMIRIQYVTNAKGQKVAVQIDLKKYGALGEDFCDAVVSEARRKEKAVPYKSTRARRLKGKV